ncbi:hypothetical protein [Paenibacillus ginsengarvi]|uniref:Uncharacterized protein n=1 Tax=Paenibacillus ginsengarvi TaxID=400777 RepID=A0A3B0BS21_9BACL|nr:hypothetical protein [Paenibacillus ginsengarvi]RKN75019.1 hypothetical protein D7M11_26140 [Paenibacillus ginsengarvi]
MGFLDSLPDSVRPAFITSFATLVGAFIGACVAQYFSHRLTIRREAIKNYRDTYFQLIAPIIIDVYAYFDMSTMFRKAHDLNEGFSEKEYKNKFLKHISENLKFASPGLRQAYTKVFRAKYTFDGEGSLEYRSELILFYTFLEDFYSINKKIKILDKRDKIELEMHMIYFSIWHMLVKVLGVDGAIRVLEHKFMFDRIKFTIKFLRSLKKYEKDYEASRGKRTHNPREFIEFLSDRLVPDDNKDSFVECTGIENIIGKDGTRTIYRD